MQYDAHVTVHDHHERWDREDVDALRYLREHEGLSLQGCADRLGRTYGAVRSKLYRLSRG